MEHKHTEHKPHHAVHTKRYAKIKKKNVWMTISAILAIVLVISVYTDGFSFSKGSGSGKVLTKEDASTKALDYINNYLLTGTTATLSNVEEDKGMYILKMTIQGNEFDSYITKDGSLLFPQGVNLAATPELPEQQQPEIEDIAKSEKPKVELYVMSFCPYGNRAEDTMYPVYQILKDKVEWEIHYIVSASGDSISSLHGQPETDQNIREVCVMNEYGLDAFWKFTTYVNTNCGSNGNCWKDAAEESNLDADKIQDCFDNEGIELMKAEADASNKAGARGSPTMIINGVKTNSVYAYGQSDTYKQAICAAFDVAPDECSDVIGEVTAAATAGGSC